MTCKAKVYTEYVRSYVTCCPKPAPFSAIYLL